MKFVIFSDTHIHSFKRFSNITDDGGNTRVDITLKVIKEVLSYCIKSNIKQVFFLGDLFHARGVIDARVFNDTFLTLEGFKENNINLQMIVGNHDLITRTSERHVLETFKTIGKVIDAQESSFLTEPPFYFFPYTEDLDSIVEFMGDMKPGAVVLGHLGIEGAVTGRHDYVLKEGFKPSIFKKAELVFLGHYHVRQSIGNIHFIGSLVPTDFGDPLQERGFIEVDPDGEKLSWKFIPVKSPQFITIEKIEDLEKCSVEGNYIRIIDKDINLQLKEDLVKKGARGVVLDVVKDYKLENRLPIDIGMNVHKIIETYVNEFSSDLDKQKLIDLGKEITNGVF